MKDTKDWDFDTKPLADLPNQLGSRVTGKGVPQILSLTVFENLFNLLHLKRERSLAPKDFVECKQQTGCSWKRSHLGPESSCSGAYRRSVGVAIRFDWFCSGEYCIESASVSI